MENEYILKIAKKCKEASNGYDLLDLLKQINEQEILEDLAQTAEDVFTRTYAVKKLTNQNIITEIATDKNLCVMLREAAIKKVTDQAVLTKIAKKPDHDDLRKAALENLNNQADILNIAQNKEAPPELRPISANKLENQDLAQEIYTDLSKTASSDSIKLAVAKKLRDKSPAETVLKVIIDSCDDSQKRLAAVELLPNPDPAYLFKIATSDQHTHVRLAAINRLDDQELLGKIARKYVRGREETATIASMRIIDTRLRAKLNKEYEEEKKIQNYFDDGEYRP